MALVPQVCANVAAGGDTKQWQRPQPGSVVEAACGANDSSSMETVPGGDTRGASTSSKGTTKGRVYRLHGHDAEVQLVAPPHRLGFPVAARNPKVIVGDTQPWNPPAAYLFGVAVAHLESGSTHVACLSGLNNTDFGHQLLAHVKVSRVLLLAAVSTPTGCSPHCTQQPDPQSVHHL